MFLYHDHFRKVLAESLSKGVQSALGVEISWEKIYPLFGNTPNKAAGDLAFPLFIIAKEAKTNPAQAAKKLEEADLGLPAFIKKKTSAGPYLNFFLDFNTIAKDFLPEVASGKAFKKKLTENTPKTMVEYSQPNTHKELHVGHMRNLCLGDALIRLHRYAGFNIIASTFP